MINLAWGDYTNGNVPVSATTAVDAAGHRLEHVAAANFLAMRDACHAATGVWINVAPGTDSANRTVAQQQADYNLYLNGGNVAAHPPDANNQGSNHGWARAVDITGYESSDAVWNWLLANAHAYGYSWATGQASGERWHWESLAAPSATALASTTATPLPKEDDMKLNAIRNYNGAIGIIDPAGLLVPVTDIGLWNCYLRLSIIQQQPDGTYWEQQPDGTVWNALTTHTAQVAAQRTSTDPKAVAANIAPLLVGPIIDAIKASGVTLTQQQVEQAAAQAIAHAFGAAATS